MSTSRELLAAQRKGAKIVTRLSAGYNGAEVVYDPRGSGDRRPWRVQGCGTFDSVRAADCMAVDAEGGAKP